MQSGHGLKISSFLLHYELSKWRTARNLCPFHFSINCFLGDVVMGCAHSSWENSLAPGRWDSMLSP